jgi:hypothetical protein
MVQPSVDKNELKLSRTLNIIDPYPVEPYPGKVFKIFVSGNVLYAVAKHAGC